MYSTKKRKPGIITILFVIAMICSWIYLGITGTAEFINEKEYDAQLVPKPAPQSGTILSGKECFDQSEITITAPKTYDCVVSLKTAAGIERVAFYVREGDTVTVGVPAELLCVYFAIGDTWYGYGDGLMFGKGTDYSKDDELKDFYTYAWEYSLQQTSSGNFSETPSDEDEFF